MREIVKSTGRTAKQIETTLWNEGWELRVHKYKQDSVSEWVQMYTGGYDGSPMSFAEIGRLVGCCANTIQLAVLRAGIRDRHPTASRRLAAQRRKEKKTH